MKCRPLSIPSLFFILFFSFGYIPHENKIKNLLLKIFGFPSIIRRIQAPVLLRMLGPKKGEIILDVGCGFGYFTREIAKKCRCVGIDKDILQASNSLIIRKSSSINFIIMDAQQTSFKNEVFDKILLSSILQMVEDDIVLLQECYRLLKKDGVLVLSVPTEYVYIKKLNKLKYSLAKIFNEKGKGIYKREELVKLLKETDFEIIEEEYSPKRWGSFIYEISLYFCYLTGLPISHPFYFPFLYPLAYCDKIDDRNQVGTEIILKVRKLR